MTFTIPNYDAWKLREPEYDNDHDEDDPLTCECPDCIQDRDELARDEAADRRAEMDRWG